MLIVTLRWFGVVILMMTLSSHLIRRQWQLLRKHLPRLIIMGMLGLAMFNALFYLSAYSTTALNIGIIQGSIPVFVLLGGLLFYRTPVTILQYAGVVLTILGVSVVATSGGLARLTELSINEGDYLMIFACALYAGYALSLQKITGIHPLPLFAVVSLASFIVSLPMTGIEYFMGNLQWPTPKGWIIVTLITLLPSFIAQVFFIQGVSDLGPGRAGLFINLVPVFSSILAVLVLGEIFQWFHALSLGLVVTGIWVAERKTRL